LVKLNTYSTFADAAKAIAEAFSSFKERSFPAIRRTLNNWHKDVLKNYDEATAKGIMLQPKDSVERFHFYFSTNLVFALLNVGDDFQLNKGFVYLNIYYDILGKQLEKQV